MRFLFLALFAIAGGIATTDQASAQRPEFPPPVHSEQGIVSRIEIAVYGHYGRLVSSATLQGTQINDKFVRHWADDLQFLIANSAWDTVLAAGANQAFDPRQEPLSYYHRTGPVGAIFRELKTRKNGADAAAPVAVLGLGAGTEAAYALRGQKFTFYEADPALKRLTADSDKYFTYIRDARDRGAEIDVKIGNRRENLQQDKDRKYAVIIVDQAESYPIAKDVFTKEAVQLYFDRLADDGIVALHVSNKYFRIEPMVGRIAVELKLQARHWFDRGGPPGKTWSSWIVLAKSEKALGTLALPLEQQMKEHGTRFIEIKALRDVRAWTDKDQDVWILSFNRDLQSLRRVFGLPTPLLEPDP